MDYEGIGSQIVLAGMLAMPAFILAFFLVKWHMNSKDSGRP